LFEEAGTLEEVTKLAIQWFDEHIATRPGSKYKLDLDESYVTEAY
jgi:hypothetical protein